MYSGNYGLFVYLKLLVWCTMCYSCVSKVESRTSGMGMLLACGVCLASIQMILASDDPGQDGQCGVEASPHPLHHDPWVVFIEFFRRGQLADVRCAGTLISSMYVLTAAHCVKTMKFNRFQARLGEYDVTTAHECLDGVCADPIVRIPVERVITHPDYDGREHDIALLKLAEEAPYTDFIRPVCLPSDHRDNATMLHAAGWGEIVAIGQYSDVKKSVQLPKWPLDKCLKTYMHDNVPKHIICAGGEEGLDTCRGDSGGPLMYTKYYVEILGVTSLGSSKCGRKGKPGIYTSVVDYLDWIKKEISIS